jgi:hypothetical protein
LWNISKEIKGEGENFLKEVFPLAKLFIKSHFIFLEKFVICPHVFQLRPAADADGICIKIVYFSTLESKQKGRVS